MDRFVEKNLDWLAGLGEMFAIISQNGENGMSHGTLAQERLQKEMEEAFLFNPWFIPEFVRYACHSWAGALEPDKIRQWLEPYSGLWKPGSPPLTVAVVMAGNIPLVGLHDLLSVLASGHRALVKLSSSDNRLIPAIFNSLVENFPGLRGRVIFTEGPLNEHDAIIATGSNNTARYFEHYFGKKPHIIRRNRNSAAVLTGSEKAGELSALADDVLMYFGLGCRNVSKLYLPRGYDPSALFPHFGRYAFVADHHKYRNNYDYRKSVMIINNVPHFDNGFLLLKEDHALISPVSVLHYEFYREIPEIERQWERFSSEIQCLAGDPVNFPRAIPFGTTQAPGLWDYADGMDTMEFLMKLALS